ncbi:hypothetical protein FDUTEX481_05014 [Tolypothrix sp. PCC 7601]|nr:hypothetical protein FDUTEX481_05014 [Tolypothrix sp. PCC 7601]
MLIAIASILVRSKHFAAYYTTSSCTDNFLPPTGAAFFDKN